MQVPDHLPAGSATDVPSSDRSAASSELACAIFRGRSAWIHRACSSAWYLAHIRNMSAEEPSVSALALEPDSAKAKDKEAKKKAKEGVWASVSVDFVLVLICTCYAQRKRPDARRKKQRRYAR